MGRPSTTLASLRPELNDSVETFDLAMNRLGFVGYLILPRFPVAVVSGTFGKIPIEQLLRNRDTRRAPGSGFGRGDWKFTEDSYATIEYGWEEPVDHQEAEIYANFFDAETVAGQICIDAILRAAELRVCNAVTDTSTMTNNTALDDAKRWTSHSAAVPIDDITSAIVDVRNTSGIMVDTLAIEWERFVDLQNNAQVIDRITASGAGTPAKPSDVTAQMLAQVFNLKEVLVAGGQQNTAKEGQAATLDTLFPKTKALLFKKNRTNNVREPGLGRTFVWNQLGDNEEPLFESYEEPQTDSTIIRRRNRVHEKIVMAEAGFVITNLAA